MMLGELNASHMGHSGGSDPIPDPDGQNAWSPTTYPPRPAVRARGPGAGPARDQRHPRQPLPPGTLGGQAGRGAARGRRPSRRAGGRHGAGPDDGRAARPRADRGRPRRQRAPGHGASHVLGGRPALRRVGRELPRQGRGGLGRQARLPAHPRHEHEQLPTNGRGPVPRRARQGRADHRRALQRRREHDRSRPDRADPAGATRSLVRAAAERAIPRTARSTHHGPSRSS